MSLNDGEGSTRMNSIQDQVTEVLSRKWRSMASIPHPSDMMQLTAALDEAGLLAQPTTPPEPPVGTVLRGNSANAWVRFSTGWQSALGIAGPVTWLEALEFGADPDRPLVEMPSAYEIEKSAREQGLRVEYAAWLHQIVRKAAGL